MNAVEHAFVDKAVDDVVAAVRRKRMVEAMSVALDAALEAVGEKGFEAHVLQNLIAGRIRSIDTERFHQSEIRRILRGWIFRGDANGDACTSIGVYIEIEHVGSHPIYSLNVKTAGLDQSIRQLIEAVEEDARHRDRDVPLRYILCAYTDASLGDWSRYFARHRFMVRPYAAV